MKRYFFCLMGILSAFLCAVSCKSLNDEEVARKYCSSCHVFPPANLLPKAVWKEQVLPQMAFRMGLDKSILQTIPPFERRAVLSVIPEKPMVSPKEWQRIVQYYQATAPDSLPLGKSTVQDTISRFNLKKILFPNVYDRFVTMLKFDSLNEGLIVGTRNGSVFQVNPVLSLQKIAQLKSPISHYMNSMNKKIFLTMGVMNPNDLAEGRLIENNNGIEKIIIDSLKRPVYFDITDLNNDHLEDVVVCEFGNYRGELSAFKNLSDGHYEKHSLLLLPGARKTKFIDWDKNGTKDIVALISQGDEKIILARNMGDFDFEITTLLRFPPVFGSSYFELQDMNNDGSVDIVYSNGDNADYSIVLKPYHGIRIFLNDGTGKFNESWFYPNPGSSQFVVQDFDLDKDQDLAVISYFPDFNHNPERGFIYFENVEGHFTPSVSKLGGAARWITMETGDIDKDGDLDIFLGALNFSLSLPDSLQKIWSAHPTDILLLENQTKNPNLRIRSAPEFEH